MKGGKGKGCMIFYLIGCYLQTIFLSLNDSEFDSYYINISNAPYTEKDQFCKLLKKIYG